MSETHTKYSYFTNYKMLLDISLELLLKLHNIYAISMNDIFLDSNIKLIKENLYINEILDILNDENTKSNSYYDNKHKTNNINYSIFQKLSQLDDYIFNYNKNNINSVFYNTNTNNNTNTTNTTTSTSSQIDKSTKNLNSLIILYKQVMNSDLIINNDYYNINSNNNPINKKEYEVNVLSNFIIQNIGFTRNNNSIVFKNLFLEVGCGKSYLYKKLKSMYNDILYIGIDKKDKLIEKTKLEDKQMLIYNYNVDYSNFNTIFNEYILKDLQSKNIINSNNCIINNSILLGLHTCGDLTSNIIKVFANTNLKAFNTLAIIGCCFNLLTEYVDNKIIDSKIFKSYVTSIGYNEKGICLDETIINNFDFKVIGFPMSKYAINTSINNNFFLGRLIRNSAMLVNENFSSNNTDLMQHIKKLFYRALLQKLIEIHVPELNKFYGFGKIKKSIGISSFKEYILLIIENLKKLKNNSVIYDKYTLGYNKLYELICPNKYSNDNFKNFLDIYYTQEYYNIFVAFFFIRVKFAKLIELYVNLDRVIYIIENNISIVKLYKIFDDNYSNRNFLIYARKE